jgi:PAS domain S-box-containing protein
VDVPLQHSSVASWEAAERFRPTADHLPVLIWISGTDKLCTWFNKTWLQFVGRTMEQEIGNGWAENVHSDDFDRCLQTYVTSFDQRVPFRMEYRLRRYDGEYQWVLDEGHPLYSQDGEFAGYIGCCLIVTDQKEVEEKLQVLNSALLQANEDLAGALERERRITQTLQSAFLPPYLPKVEGIEFQAVYQPAEREAQVGGDWYDAFVLRDGRVALSIGDVFGHGLDAAGAMIRVRETLRALTGVIFDDPGAILKAADRVLQARHVGSIASGVFSIYDPSSRRLLTANAGHPRPVLVRGGKATLIRSEGVPLGVLPNSTFEVHECQLQPGDSFVLYTDGLVESKHDFVSGEQLLLQHVAAGPVDADALVGSLTANSRNDDVAVLVLSVSTAASSVWQFETGDTRHSQASVGNASLSA